MIANYSNQLIFAGCYRAFILRAPAVNITVPIGEKKIERRFYTLQVFFNFFIDALRSKWRDQMKRIRKLGCVMRTTLAVKRYLSRRYLLCGKTRTGSLAKIDRAAQIETWQRKM